MGVSGGRSRHRPPHRTVRARLGAWVNESDHESRSGSLLRGFGWLVALWLLGVALFVLFFARAT